MSYSSFIDKTSTGAIHLNTQYHGQVRFVIIFISVYRHLNPLVHYKHVKGGVGYLPDTLSIYSFSLSIQQSSMSMLR